MDPYRQERDALSRLDRQGKRKLLDLIAAYKEVFLGSAAGRLVLNDVLARCRVFSTTFTGNSQTFFLEGGRAIGLQILEMLEVGKFEDLQTLLNPEEDNHG